MVHNQFFYIRNFSFRTLRFLQKQFKHLFHKRCCVMVSFSQHHTLDYFFLLFLRDTFCFTYAMSPTTSTYSRYKLSFSCYLLCFGKWELHTLTISCRKRYFGFKLPNLPFRTSILSVILLLSFLHSFKSP